MAERRPGPAAAGKGRGAGTLSRHGLPVLLIQRVRPTPCRDLWDFSTNRPIAGDETHHDPEHGGGINDPGAPSKLAKSVCDDHFVSRHVMQGEAEWLLGDRVWGLGAQDGAGTTVARPEWSTLLNFFYQQY